MSLLGNLITQVARQAMDPEDGRRNPVNQRINPRRTSGMGDILGSVLGGNTQQRQPHSNAGFGMDDILGGVLGSQMGRQMGGQSAGMGGLGSILGGVLGSQMGGRNRRAGMGGKGLLIAALMPMVLGWIQRNGGLSGALSKVQDLGFGNQAQSWMSTEQQNDNIDPMQVDRLFDQQEIQQVAAQTGADETEVRQGLSELLPEVMNQLTPNGDLATETEANQEIEDILQQISGALK